MVLGINVNLLAVLIAAIASLIVNSLWYGPIFGKTWTRLSGMSKQKMDAMKKKGMGMSYFMAFISSLVLGFVLSAFIGLSGAANMSSAIAVGFLAWVGFIAPEIMGGVLWKGDSMGYFWIHGLGQLVTIAIMSAIIFAW